MTSFDILRIKGHFDVLTSETLPKEAVLRATAELYESKQHSDVTIECGTEQIPAHGFLLSFRSTYFRGALGGGFLEGLTNKITLPGDELNTLRRALSYIYTLNYDDAEKDEPQFTDRELQDRRQHNWDTDHFKWGFVRPDDLSVLQSCFKRDPPIIWTAPTEAWGIRTGNKCMNNALVYAFADKYDIIGLKELAKTKFLRSLETNFSKLRHLEVVQAVFETTPDSDDGLRDMMAIHCSELLILRDLNYEETPLEELVPDVGGLPFRVLTHSHEFYNTLRKFKNKAISDLEDDVQDEQRKERRRDRRLRANNELQTEQATKYEENLRCSICLDSSRPKFWTENASKVNSILGNYRYIVGHCPQCDRNLI
ncbi:MAG: hypothetical protein M4579_005140 [Chaenotheca gracillima]|nr:MAG: hypothetical protein M4579_005140 [Chaenotheca gracillima]